MNRREFIKGSVLTGTAIALGVATKQKVAQQNVAKIRKTELWLLKTGQPHLNNELTKTILDVL